MRDLPIETTALVANLPYNDAVPVVLHLLETAPLKAPAKALKSHAPNFQVGVYGGIRF